MNIEKQLSELHETCPNCARLTRELDAARVEIQKWNDAAIRCALANDLHPAAEWRSLFLSHPGGQDMNNKPMICEGTCPVVARLTRELNEVIEQRNRALYSLRGMLEPGAAGSLTSWSLKSDWIAPQPIAEGKP